MNKEATTMTTRPLCAILLLALTLAAVTAPAEELLTRDSVRNLAVSRSSTLQRVLASVDAALLQEKIQGYSLSPSLSASAGAGLTYPTADAAQGLHGSVGLTVTQTIYDGGRSAIMSAIDSLATRMAREEARTEYLAVLEAADTAFSGVLEAAASLDAARSDWEAARTHQGLAAARLEAGIITRSDYLKTEAETAAAHTSVSQAQGKLSVAYAKLSSLTGLSLPLSLQSAEPAGMTDLVQRVADFTPDQTASLIARVQQAVAEANPTLAKADLARQKAQGSTSLAKAEYLPDLSASLANTAAYSSGAFAAGGSLSLSVSIPLSFWVTRAGVSAAQISEKQAGLDLQETRRSLELDVQAAVHDLVSSAGSVVSSGKALAYAESHREAVLEQFTLSAASSSELSDAAALTSASRTQLISARAQFRADLTTLRTLAALETDDLLIRLIP